MSREKLSPQQWARLESELRKGPLAHGFAGDQRWTLGRIKTLIGRMFHVGYTPEGVWKLMRRHGWSLGASAALGQGATFYFRPTEQDDERREQDHPAG